MMKKIKCVTVKNLDNPDDFIWLFDTNEEADQFIAEKGWKSVCKTYHYED